jgi:GntR family transcriptional regulator/MocR family aminotransferase
MILVDLKRSNGEPLFVQVANQLVALIGSGSLKVGDRLPSTRSLSEQLKVNRSTVCRAYEELAAMGYTESSPGGYTTVRQRMAISRKPSAEVLEGDEQFGLLPSSTLTEVEQLLERHTCSDPSFTGIDFRPLSPDPQLMPVADFRRAMDRVLAKSGISLLAYGDEKGYGPLRAMVADHMLQHCITASEENIVLTESVQNGLDLMLRLAVRPGDRVAVEVPTYNMVIPLLRCHGAEVVEIPMREDGMCLDSLERAMQEAPLSLVYTMPNFHNPTGITTGQEHRELLLQLCERHDVLILEDGFEEELKYNGRVVLPIKSMDRRGGGVPRDLLEDAVPGRSGGMVGGRCSNCTAAARAKANLRVRDAHRLPGGGLPAS